MNEVLTIRLIAEINQQSVAAVCTIVENHLNAGIKKFNLMIASPGGSVFHGIALYNFLKGIPAEINTYNFGNIDSIATVVYCAGIKRFCVPNCRFLIHSVGWGTKEPINLLEKQLNELVQNLETDRENIAKIIAANCDKKQSEIEKLMFTGTTFTADQAKEFGLVHEISPILLKENEKIIGIG